METFYENPACHALAEHDPVPEVYYRGHDLRAAVEGAENILTQASKPDLLRRFGAFLLEGCEICGLCYGGVPSSEWPEHLKSRPKT